MTDDTMYTGFNPSDSPTHSAVILKNRDGSRPAPRPAFPDYDDAQELARSVGGNRGTDE